MSNPDESPVILSDEMTDEELLELANGGSDEVLRAIAQHPQASLRTLSHISSSCKFSKDGHFYTIEMTTELLANPTVMLALVSGSGENFDDAIVLIRYVSMSTKNCESMLAIFDLGIPLILETLANNKNLPGDIVSKLMSHTNVSIRRTLAYNESVGVGVFQKLLQDDDEYVRLGAKKTLQKLGLPLDNSRALNPAPDAGKPAAHVAAGREATIARIVTQGRTSGALLEGQDMLVEVFAKAWPAGLQATFAITPGDFVRIPFPADYAGLRGWGTRPEDLTSLLPLAEQALASVVTDRVLDVAQGKAAVLTVGIDLVDGPRGSHAELVAIFDVGQRKLVRWTGKSYPHASQVASLVQVTDLETHFIEIAGERVLVLGCHDLHMLGPRGKKKAKEAADKSRYKRAMAMQKMAKKYKPTIVLQHPHGTDTPGPWIVPWSELTSMLPSVTCYASGIGYYRWSANPKAPTTERATLERVLRLTHGGQENEVVDVVIRAR